MIPISLTLSGIYSYQQPQTINFTKLTEASIFGIFGSVGSGKSTILEAISYALYGETERLNQRENRGYNMMNLKSSELLIDFIFRAGDGEREYRFKVTGKRNRNHFDRINTFERAAYQKQEAEWLPMDVGNAERIIGLSYQNFRRTIIIPQGKFQEFLQLGDTERTRMMKELFNLNKYELFHKVTGLEKKNGDERMVLEDRLKQIGEIDAGQIDLRREALAAIQKNIEANAQSLTDKQQVDSAFAQLKELFERIQVQQRAFASLQAQEEAYDQLGEQIRQYEYCLLYFKGLLDNQRSIRNEIARLSDTIDRQQVELQQLTSRLAAEEAAYAQLKAAYDRREDWRIEAEELEKIVQVLNLDSQAEQRRERISNGEMFYSRALNNVAQIRQAQEALSTDIRLLKAGSPNSAVLSDVSRWFAVNHQLQAHKTSLCQDIEQVNVKMRQVNARKEELIRSALWALVPKADFNTALPPLLVLVEETGERLERKIADLDQEMQHLLLQSKLEAYATALSEGAPCPLCGSTDHPHKLNASEVNEVLGEKGRKKGELQAGRALLESSGKKLAQLVVQNQEQRQQLEQVQQKLKAQEASLKAHQQAFIWSDFRPDDEMHFKTILAEANRLQKEIEEKESRLTHLNSQLPAEEQNREKYRLALEKLQKEVAEISGRAGIYRDQITQLDIAAYAHRKPADLKEEAQEKLAQYENIEAGYRAAEKRIQSLCVEAGTLSGGIQTGEDSLESCRAQAQAVAQQLEAHVAASAFAALDEVLAVLNQPLALAQEKKRYDAFRQQLHTTQAQHHTLVEQAQGRSYDGKAHTELLADIARLREERNALRRQSVTLENEINKLEKDLKLRRALLQQLDTLQQRAEDIHTLKKMFRESGFVNYVSSVYLQNLCKAANERFYKLTRQKLQLEITEKNEFQIRDFLHNGQVRSVKTLSGGQTFQAALCLALALADNIQQLTQSSQNFFFLDEGFGSLDRESLQIVFDTLKALRKENRIVGVISHVEEMQYEIDTYLRIVNDEVTGSVVHSSWQK